VRVVHRRSGGRSACVSYLLLSPGPLVHHVVRANCPLFFLEPINRGLSVPAYPLINLPLTRAWHVFWATDACCHSSPPLPDRNPIPIALSDYLSACRFAVSERNFREQRSSCACPEIDGGQRSDQSFPSKARRNGTTKKFPFEEQ